MSKHEEFHFVAGALALDFVDTLGNLRAEPIERLRTSTDLDRWLVAADLALSSGVCATQKQLRAAHKLRAAIHAMAMSVLNDTVASDAHISLLNRSAGRMPLRPKIVASRYVLTADDPVDAALSNIAADAIVLIMGAQRKRIKVCPECRMLFFDASRPGKRIWCSSSSGCGNRAKVRNHRSRSNALTHGVDCD